MCATSLPMRVFIQRVEQAHVELVEETAQIASTPTVISAINHGAVAYVGIGPEDTCLPTAMVENLVYSLLHLLEKLGFLNGELLCLSQFTLFARFKGQKPSFSSAAPPDAAAKTYQHVLDILSHRIGPRLKQGRFRTHLAIHITHSQDNSIKEKTYSNNTPSTLSLPTACMLEGAFIDSAPKWTVL